MLMIKMKNDNRLTYIIALMIFVLIFSTNSYSQNIKSVDDLSKNNICEYSIEKLQKFDSLFYYIKESFVQTDIDETNKDFNLFLINITTSRCFDFNNDYGIYIVGKMSSHPFLKLLFLNKDGSHELTLCKKPTVIMSKLNEYFHENGIQSNEEHISIMFGAIKYLNQENGYPISKTCIGYSWQCDSIVNKP